MDLIAWFALAYVWQCALAVRGGSHLLGRRFGVWQESPGSGWRLAPLWPSAPSLVASTRADGPEALSIERFRAAFERARTATRAAARCCDLYLVAVLVALPALCLWLEPERVLRRAAPLLLVLHVGTWLLVKRAYRRLDTASARKASRWEALAAAALYPPALLRAPHDLLAAELAPFHPMTARAALWERRRFVERVQQALAQLAAAASGTGLGLDGGVEHELDAARLRRLAADHGVTPDELAAPRPRSDPDAASYCARCLFDYRPGFQRCADCGGRTTLYPGCG